MPTESEKPTRPLIEALIQKLAPVYGLDPEICIRQCEAESGFDIDARVRRGCIGLYQLSAEMAEKLDLDRLWWRQNVQGGLRRLAWMMEEFGSIDKALAACDCGHTRLERIIRCHELNWRKRLPPETQRYLKKILHPGIIDS